MISVNISQNGADSTTNYIQVEHFPDNSQRLNNVPVLSPTHSTIITFWWQYEKDEELATLIYLSKHYKNEYPGVNQVLLMPYIPNARMDRVYNKSEVFTLKHFAETINWLGFTKVISFDAHSDVSVALIDRLTNKSIVDIVNEVCKKIMSDNESVFDSNDIIFYFPDNGAYKKYSKQFKNHTNMIYGVKVRNWNTGKIEGLTVETNGIDLSGKTILMIDDIISYGGTMYYSAKKLKELGVGKIYAYATHVENSFDDIEKGTFNKCLKDGTVENLFTFIGSIYNGNNSKVIRISK